MLRTVSLSDIKSLIILTKAFGAVKRAKRMPNVYIVALTSLAHRGKQRVAICLPFTLKFLLYQESGHLNQVSFYFYACTKCCEIYSRNQVLRVNDRVQPMAGLHTSQHHPMRKSEKTPKTPYGSYCQGSSNTVLYFEARQTTGCLHLCFYE